jgi:DNA-binding MarR family transcriptional regulator
MSSDDPESAPLLADLEREIRRFGIQSALLGDAIADRLGMAATDLRCLCLIEKNECVTAGEVAERTGLTTGAVTGLIDRLERAGFVERTRDPLDRRRVIIRLTQQVDRRLDPVFATIRGQMSELWAGLAPAQIDLLREFFRRSHGVLHAQQVRMRAMADKDPVGAAPPKA